ncbi:MAG: PAS domain-containing sensor histidine kinase [Proteobacteria bacterium]|nr:PAS domain-containing sensor histidine kinase [Pseudomonadota bacterium]
MRWSRRVGLARKLEIGLFGLALISLVATFAALSIKSSPMGVTSGTVGALLVADGVLGLAMGALVARRLVKLWVARKEGLAGSKLLGKMVGFFSFIAVVPTIIMVIFSAVYLQFGIESWFSDKVRTTLDSSLEVAEAYIKEHRRVIEADIRAMANDLNRQAIFVQQDTRLLQILVEDQTAKRALSEAIVFDGRGTLMARATLNLALAPIGVPDMVMARAQQGKLVIISSTDDDRVRAIVKLEEFFDAYLYVSRFVDARVLGHLDAVEGAIAEYQDMAAQRGDLQVQFGFFYFVAALLLLMFAVWMGLSFATRMVAPISRLVEASERVGQGDLSARVPSQTSSDEIGILSRAFNRMTRQLQNQQEALIETNNQLDERRRFSEAVLSGVSAGVIGLDLNFRVTLPNPTACEFLEGDLAAVVGKDIRKLIPEFAPFLAGLQQDLEPSSLQAQIDVMRSGAERTLLVRLSTETSEQRVTGYVVTFDDITDQLVDQRTAAWADVARRIAHEIKNPLTPIQLAAERLQRKYGDEIASDPRVFQQCTETIIRQVGDLRRMVDEFSSFARMPAPLFRIEDISDVARQALFMQQVGSPAIKFDFEAPSQAPLLVCDGRLIAQALTNLIKNAVESISARQSGEAPEGSASEIQSDEAGYIKISVLPSVETLEITVEDNGAGLPAGLSQRLTEPYVTTRAKGTGLGLAIVRKIMEDHGGSLVLENRGEGGVRAMLSFNHKELLKRTVEAVDGDGDAPGAAGEVTNKLEKQQA